MLLLIAQVTHCPDAAWQTKWARSQCTKAWWELRHLSAVMNSKHLHYSRKQERWSDGEEGRKENKCPALKLATGDLTCYKPQSNKKQPPLQTSPSASLKAPVTPPPATIRHTHTHTPAQPAFFEMFFLLMGSTTGRITLNAKRPQTLRSVVLIRTNRLPSLARAGAGVQREKRERKWATMKRESVGWRKGEYGMAEDRERERSGIVLQTEFP